MGVLGSDFPVNGKNSVGLVTVFPTTRLQPVGLVLCVYVAAVPAGAIRVILRVQRTCDRPVTAHLL